MLVKIAIYICFCVFSKSYLIWSPVIALLPCLRSTPPPRHNGVWRQNLHHCNHAFRVFRPLAHRQVSVYLEDESPVSAAFLDDFLAWRSSGIRVTQCFTSETPGTPPNVEVSTVLSDARVHEVPGTNLSPRRLLTMWPGRLFHPACLQRRLQTYRYL